MSCNDFARGVVDLIAGELPREERERLEEHARDCSACGANLESLRATLRRLDGLDPLRGATCGEKLRVDTGRLLHAVLARSERSARRWQIAGAAAACALVVVAAALAMRARRAPPPPPPQTELAAIEDVLDAVEGHGKRLAALEDLVQLVVVEVETGSASSANALAELRGKLAELRGRLGEIERRSGERWRRLDEDVSAVYHLARRGVD